ADWSVTATIDSFNRTMRRDPATSITRRVARPSLPGPAVAGAGALSAARGIVRGLGVWFSYVTSNLSVGHETTSVGILYACPRGCQHNSRDAGLFEARGTEIGG